jgi:hypothetical protein
MNIWEKVIIRKHQKQQNDMKTSDSVSFSLYEDNEKYKILYAP